MARWYATLDSGGGGWGRNCDGRFSTNGAVTAWNLNAPGANAGGVGRHSPGAVPPKKGSPANYEGRAIQWQQGGCGFVSGLQSGISCVGHRGIGHGRKTGVRGPVEARQRAVGRRRGRRCRRANPQQCRVLVLVCLKPALDRLDGIVHGGLDQGDVEQSGWPCTVTGASYGNGVPFGYNVRLCG